MYDIKPSRTIEEIAKKYGDFTSMFGEQPDDVTINENITSIQDNDILSEYEEKNENDPGNEC